MRLHRCRPLRRGIQSVEVLMSLPIVVLVMVSGVHHGLAGITKQTLQCAVSVAASHAAMGCEPREIEDAVNEVLSVHEMSLAEGMLLLVESSRGLEIAIGDRDIEHGLLSEKRRALVAGEYRALLVVDRETTAIPSSIKLFETEIENQNLVAVATSIHR